MRRPAAIIALAMTFAALLIAPAQADATAYRYWTYWTVGEQGEWKFSQLGPASTRPGDGSVEGWRFALSTGTRGQGAQPRITPEAAFRQFCGDKTAPSGQKRVGVVFDFGSSADAPPGQLPPPAKGTCVVIAADATGGEVLAEAADVRVSDGMVCAIGGYPQGECAPAVVDPTPTPDSSAKSRDRNRSAPDKEPPAEQPPADDPPADSPPADDETKQATKKTDSTAQKPPAKRAPAPPPTGVPGGTTAAGASPDGVVPAAPQPVAPSTSATAAPVFTEAEAREAPNESGPARALLGIALLAGLVGVIGWRRASRGSS